MSVRLLLRLLGGAYFYLNLSICFAWSLQSFHQQDNRLHLVTDGPTVTLTVLENDGFAVHYQRQGFAETPGFALSENTRQSAFSLQESAERLEIRKNDLTVSIDKATLEIRFYRGDELLLTETGEAHIAPAARKVSFKIQPQDKLLGGGERIVGMDRRGHEFPLYNQAHYGYTTSSNQMYYGLPAIMSSRKFALIFDNAARGSMDLAKTESDKVTFSAVGGRLSYIVSVGDDYPDLLANFTQLTGRQPLPPRWLLGNLASRFGYRNQAEVHDVVERHQQASIPLDAVILDLYWFGPDVKGHMGKLSWDKQAFPEPEKMIETLDRQGVKTVLITEPFILTTTPTWQKGDGQQAFAVDINGNSKTFDFFFGNTSLVDVFSQQGSDWFMAQYKRLHGQGVAGWWGDLGEPEVHPQDAYHIVNGQKVPADWVHNAYGHQWAKQVYQTINAMQPDERVMLMMRSGFVGSQRYGMVPWTGDVSRSWGGLTPQVELNLQMGMFGLAYTHSDLGGFAGGQSFDSELYVRWLQFGAFQPVFRPHGQDDIAPEPVFHDPMTQQLVGEYIRLRYRLLPYNYTLAIENTLTGMPLARPMLMLSDALFEVKDQFMWGDALLVKPITAAGVNHTTIHLPGGVWFNYWDDKRFDGLTAEVAAPLHQLPMLVKAGAFIPMTASMQTTQDYDAEQLTLHYYDDQSVTESSSVMHEDDGTSAFDLNAPVMQTLTFKARRDAQFLTLMVEKQGEYPGAPQQRQLELVIHNQEAAPLSVTLDNNPLERSSSAQSPSTPSWHWDAHSNRLRIQAVLKSDSIRLQIKGQANDKLAVNTYAVD